MLLQYEAWTLGTEQAKCDSASYGGVIKMLYGDISERIATDS